MRASMLLRCVTLLLALLVLHGVALAEDAPTRTLITNVRVWDGTSDGLSGKTNVLIEDNFIARISAGTARAIGDTTVIEHVVGDVSGRDVLMVDDMVSTGGSITDAARIVKEKGAEHIYIAASHALLVGKAVETLNASPVEKIIFTDSIPLENAGVERLMPASVAPLLARAIDRIHRSESVSVLFEDKLETAEK